MPISTRTFKNITDNCRLFNLSQTVYYKWLKRFKNLGYPGLLNSQRAKPIMPNELKPEYETIVYNYITDYPNHGPRRIAYELRIQGINISETGVYHVLKRRGLNRRLDRLFYAQEHWDNPIITERYLRELEKQECLYLFEPVTG